jgi:hypothetical protein
MQPSDADELSEPLALAVVKVERISAEGMSDQIDPATRRMWLVRTTIKFG